MLHPAFQSTPGHKTWKRDFTGSASVFSVVLRDGTTPEQVTQFVDALVLFKIGYSWGGTTALVLTYPGLGRPSAEAGDRLVRLNVGLEEPDDLIADLAQAFEVTLHRSTGNPTHIPANNAVRRDLSYKPRSAPYHWFHRHDGRWTERLNRG